MKKIIISRTDNIGDVVLTLPIAGYLKQLFVGCHIVFVGKSYTKAIIKASEYINEFIDWSKISTLDEKAQIEIFSNINADAIIHVFPNKKIAFIAKKAKIPIRIGTSHRFFHWPTCNKLVNLSRKNSNLHEAQLNIKLLSALNVDTDLTLEKIKQLFGIKINKNTKTNFTDLIDYHKFNLILHPKSKGSAREWGLDNFEKLISLLPDSKFKIFISGSEDEGIILKDFITKNKHRITDITGRFILTEFIDFIAAADGMVAASTGPLHIASVYGKTTIGLYAPLRPIFKERWGALGDDVFNLSVEKKCDKCKKNTKCTCIEEIKPEIVAEILLQKTKS